MTSMRKLVTFGLTLLILAALALPAVAGDHLFNAAHSSGVIERGFANPVAANPSHVSGPKAQPGTVPGEGDPKSGLDTGTPSVDCALLDSNPAFCN